MTHEGRKLTETWVEDQGARYGYAYDTSMKLMRELEGNGFPSAALIDASGTILWTGHPGAISEKLIEKAIVGALAKPMWEWPKEAASVRKALQKQDLAKALEAAQEMEDGADYVAIVERVIQSRVDGLVSAFEAGDFLNAFETAGELKKALKGLPDAEKAADIYDRIKSDSDAQQVIKAQKAILKLSAEVDELRKRKDAESILDDLRKLQQKHPGTFAADQAGELADRIRKLIPNLR